MTATSPNPTHASASRESSALRHLLFAGSVIGALLLCGCASRAPWQKQNFAITAPFAEPGPAAHTNVLALHHVTVSTLFEGRPLVYRMGEERYESDPYAEFLAPPHQMLEECVRAWLRNGHAFAEVIDPGSSLKPSCSMEVSVNQLYGDFRESNRNYAVLELRFLLYSDVAGERGRVIWSHERIKRVPFGKRVPGALVSAWGTALKEIMDEVNAELKQLSIPQS